MSSQTPNISPKPDAEEFSMTHDVPVTHDIPTTFERADNRWDPAHASRDWIIIAVMVIIYVAWMGTMYLFEPGIR